MSEAQNYFKKPVFQLLAKELWRRYWNKGNFGTSVGMKHFAQTDTEPLRSFLGITVLAWDKRKSMRIADFEKTLAQSVLGWTLADFITFVLKRPLLLKSEYEQKEKESFQQFCQDVESIDDCFTERLTEKQLKAWWKLEMSDLTVFQQVAAALKQLPTTDFVRLPVFAYQVTGDPHALDESKKGGQLFLQLLAALSEQEKEKFAGLEKAERRNGLLAEFHLLKDDIMNYAAIRGLRALNLQGEENQLWYQACLEGISWNVPLKEILRMETIYPYQTDKVVVVENSGVYSILVDLLPEVPIICSSGQFTFAIWQLLRKLVKGGSQLYYSGDLDPEGLGMAQKLKDVFGSQIDWIGMDLHNFQLAKSEINLSANRLNKLHMITDPALLKIAGTIRLEKKVAYQEGFLAQLVDEVDWKFSE